jgi:hypothetical protein
MLTNLAAALVRPNFFQTFGIDKISVTVFSPALSDARSELAVFVDVACPQSCICDDRNSGISTHKNENNNNIGCLID